MSYDVYDVYLYIYDLYVYIHVCMCIGVGLNLIGANRLIMMDIDWNPATDLQVHYIYI